MGGQQPISGATIQLYTVGTTADYSAAKPLLTKTVTTDVTGSFSITGLYSCTSATQVYLTATGGNTGGSTVNPNSVVMVALGSCTSLTTVPFLNVNELTTVAAVAAMGNFMTSATNVGSSTYDAPALAQDVALATELVSFASGSAPGTNVPSGMSVNAPLINTLGNVLAACVNTTGGAAGDSGTPCGTLFSLARNSSGTAPTDTVSAMLNIANHPTVNVMSIFNTSTTTPPFAPALTTAPSTFKVALIPPAFTLSRSLLIEPDNGFSTLYALVNNAKSTIDMTMYELVDTTFSGDLVTACGRGVKVRVILDQNDEKTSNTPAYNQINAVANCSAVWANPTYSVTHQKTFTVDNSTVAILTLNLTSRYYTQDRDYAIIENDPVDIAAVEATFAADYVSATYYPTAGDNLIWSPTSAQSSLIAIINNATSTLYVENEEMSATNIVSALEAACQRHVTVEIAMTDDGSYHTEYAALEAAGCGVHTYADSTKVIYIHGKVILADYGTAAQLAYMGSINFSTASLTEDRELGLYVTDSSILQSFYTTITADYAGAAAYQ